MAHANRLSAKRNPRGTRLLSTPIVDLFFLPQVIMHAVCPKYYTLVTAENLSEHGYLLLWPDTNASCNLGDVENKLAVLVFAWVCIFSAQ